MTRTFTTQVEALKRYRTGGEQKVTVKHVTVNSGGQAIVGNVSHGSENASSPVASGASALVVLYANGGGGHQNTG